MAKLHKNVYSLHLLSLPILCFLCMCNAASDSLPLTWASIRVEVSGWMYCFRSESLSICYISFRISNIGFWKGLPFSLSVCNNRLGFYSSFSIFQFGICLQYLCFGVGDGGFGILLLYFVWRLYGCQNELGTSCTKLYTWSAVCTAAVHLNSSLVSIHLYCRTWRQPGLPSKQKYLNLFCLKRYIHIPSQPATTAAVEVSLELKNVINWK